MSPYTFIFIGRSGCGKGTQVELLKEVLKKSDPETRDIFHLETGQKFRELVRLPNYTSSLAYEISKSGERQPDFLAVHIWSHVFIEEYNGRQHLIIDGTPRSKNEAQVLDTAMKFYGIKNPFVVYINVSDEWSRERLMNRGRADDKSENEVNKRLEWYKRDVVPAIEYYKEHPEYAFVEINGEQSIEEVHQELMEKLSLFK